MGMGFGWQEHVRSNPRKVSKCFSFLWPPKAFLLTHICFYKGVSDLTEEGSKGIVGNLLITTKKWLLPSSWPNSSPLTLGSWVLFTGPCICIAFEIISSNVGSTWSDSRKFSAVPLLWTQDLNSDRRRWARTLSFSILTSVAGTVFCWSIFSIQRHVDLTEEEGARMYTCWWDTVSCWDILFGKCVPNLTEQGGQGRNFQRLY